MGSQRAVVNPITLSDLAVLAQLPYASDGKPCGYIANARDWTPIDEVKVAAAGGQAQGFFGQAYKRGENVVIAVRGTDNLTDVMADLHMVPNGLSGERANEVIRNILAIWEGRDSSPGSQALSAAAERVFNTQGAQEGTKTYCNQIPTTHAGKAMQLAHLADAYAQKNGLTLRAVTGHSLGGGLAQFISEQTGAGGKLSDIRPIAGAAFNSVVMGKIAGMRPYGGGGIVVVNTRLDPLHLAMQYAGNKSHAWGPTRQFDLDLPRFGAKPPNEKLYPTDESYYKLFKQWFAVAAVYYHSMLNLAKWLEGDGARVGNKTLQSIFPGKWSDPAKAY